MNLPGDVVMSDPSALPDAVTPDKDPADSHRGTIVAAASRDLRAQLVRDLERRLSGRLATSTP